jgi:hypothetical protein
VTTWHVITGEYPPQPGGVADYTRQIARGLVEAGDRVEVWAPAGAREQESIEREPGVGVHRLSGRFGVMSLWQLDRAISRFPPPRRLLVQYVPHAFGSKGVNIPFCLWVRSRRRDSTWVMFHEVMFQADGDPRPSRQALALANRLMATLVAGAAERAFVSIPGWRPLVEPLLSPGATLTWLPVPSAIPFVKDSAATAAIRSRFAEGRPLVGHFGTYGDAVGTLLEKTLKELAAISDCHVLLLGDRSDVASGRITAGHPSLAGRLFATGRLTAPELSRHIAACDLMLQPYPDGVSTRRTSAMVALAHGRALVTTSGWLTEPIWADAGAAVLSPVDQPQALAAAASRLLSDERQRDEMGSRAAALYDARFHVRHAVSALRSVNGDGEASRFAR